MFLKEIDWAVLQVCVKWPEPVVPVVPGIVGLDAANPGVFLWHITGALCVVTLKVEPE